MATSKASSAEAFRSTRDADIKAELCELTAPHVALLDVLDRGGTLADAAKAVDRSERTVRRWLRYHPAVRAERNRRHALVAARSAEELAGLFAAAVGVVRRAVDDGDAATALAVVRLIPADVLQRAFPRPGPVNPEDIIESDARTIGPGELDDMDAATKPKDPYLESIGLEQPSFPPALITRQRQAILPRLAAEALDEGD